MSDLEKYLRIKISPVPKKSPRTSFSVKSSKKKRWAAPPRKQPNAKKRSREYVTPDEVKLMIDAAKDVGRHPDRDALLILMTYRHALRVGEVVDLKWDQVDLSRAKIHVNRLKNGDSSVHFLEGDEVRALRKIRRSYPDSAFVFCSERHGPLSVNAVHKLVVRAGKLANLELSVHPHMLRHGKGCQLADRGEDTRAIQAYMGHKNIQHTVLYTNLDSARFKGFGRDVHLR
jgi:type 1 fimbriae regulatory protein FimB/type 1 fimbriae regulatory protein FimE